MQNIFLKITVSTCLFLLLPVLSGNVVVAQNEAEKQAMEQFHKMAIDHYSSDDRYGIEKFGFENESQVVEQAKKTATQSTPQQNTELQFQDPQKLRNQISEIGRQKGRFYKIPATNYIFEKVVDRMERAKEAEIARIAADAQNKNYNIFDTTPQREHIAGEKEKAAWGAISNAVDFVTTTIAKRSMSVAGGIALVSYHGYGVFSNTFRALEEVVGIPQKKRVFTGGLFGDLGRAFTMLGNDYGWETFNQLGEKLDGWDKALNVAEALVIPNGLSGKIGAFKTGVDLGVEDHYKLEEKLFGNEDDASKQVLENNSKIKNVPDSNKTQISEITEEMDHDHIHFFADDGSYNVGYFEDGIHEIEKSNNMIAIADKYDDEYDIEIMLEAADGLRQSGNWQPEEQPNGYDIRSHNCQDFAEELRQVYYIRKVLKQFQDKAHSFVLRISIRSSAITSEQSKKGKDGLNQLYSSPDSTETGEDYLLRYGSRRDYPEIISEFNKLLKNTEKDLSRCPDDFQKKFRKYISDGIIGFEYVLTVCKAHRNDRLGGGWEPNGGLYKEVRKDFSEKETKLFRFYENELCPVLKKYGVVIRNTDFYFSL
ncbi:MAG: hypothetical protein LBL39_06855 [Planctomycetaceae bacterium]|jgi:hypothetical protein|nr:hypothetical protein [Planctomycetaceae bacterium]